MDTLTADQTDAPNPEIATLFQAERHCTGSVILIVLRTPRAVKKDYFQPLIEKPMKI